MAAQRQRQATAAPRVVAAAARLPAKLVGRSAAGGIDRDRLFDHIDSQSRCPLLWVQGPAGAGKTLLVASHVARRRLPALWYRVDDGDIDAATVLSYLARGAAGITRRRAPPLPALTAEYRLDVPGFARRFFRAFFGRLPARAVLVFDSFENAPGDALQQLLLLAADELLPGQRIAVTSRDAPPERLAHLPSKGVMAVIGWDALRLTDAEALAVAGGAAADAAAVRRLLHAADGWAAGFVVLLAHARRAPAPTGGTAPAAATAELFAYYLNELFAGADPALQSLLTHTALLPSFTAAQAQALTPGIDAAAALSRLLRRHFFISRSSSSADAVHTYHPLFRDFLLHQGSERLGIAERRALLLQSAALLQAAGEAEPAFELLLQAQARDRAVEVLCSLAPRLLQQGRSATLLQCIAALPPGTSAIEHQVHHWHGMALLELQPPRARAELQIAYAGFDAAGDATGRLLACAAILDSYVQGFGDIRPVDAWGALLQRLLHDSAGPLAPEVEVRVLLGLQVLLFRGHVHARLVADGRARALALLQRLDDPMLRLGAARFAVMAYYLAGEWHAGRRFIAETEPALPPPSVLPAFTALRLAMQARLMVWDGDAAAALAVAQQAEDIAADNNIVALSVITASAAAFAALNLDDAARADAVLQRMRAAVLPSRRLDVATLDLQSGLLALLRGQPQPAADALQAGLATVLEQGSELMAAQFRIALALALAAGGADAAAVSALLLVENHAAAAHIPMLRHSALTVRAWLAQRRGDAAAALALLREVLPLGRRNGWRVVFPWVPRALLQDMALLALPHGIEPDHVRDMLRLRRVPPPAADADDWPWHVRVTTLGRFAVEIDGRPLPPTPKAQKKPLEVLRMLAAASGAPGGVALSALQDALWHEAQGDAAPNACHVALHRLRRLLRDEAAVVVRDGRAWLDPDRVWTDVASFTASADRIDAAGDTVEPRAAAAALLRHYRGHFLADDAAPWALVQRERLRSRLLRTAVLLVQRLQQGGDLAAAVDVQRRVLEIDPLAEDMHQALVRCLAALGRRAEALDACERWRTLLQTLKQRSPSPALAALERELARSP